MSIKTVLLTSQMFRIVHKNLEVINRQVSENDPLAVRLGQAYNMCMEHMDIFSLSIFEGTFQQWYSKYSHLLKE